MNKQNLVPVSNVLSGFATLPEPKKGEKIETYTKRAYKAFDEFLENTAQEIDEVSDFVATIGNKPIYNAIAKIPIRRSIVAKWCAVNDPVEITEPEEATTADILEHNGLPKDLDKSMEKDAFENLIKKLKTPKSQGLSKTERQEMIENHHAKYEPIMPSEKEYEHGTGGKTRKYHWESGLQDAFLSDHVNFVDSLKIDDRFHSEEKVETESDNEPETETESAEN